MVSTCIGSKLHTFFINQTLICYLYLLLIILILLPPIYCLVLLTSLLVAPVQTIYSFQNNILFPLKKGVSISTSFTMQLLNHTCQDIATD